MQINCNAARDRNTHITDSYIDSMSDLIIIPLTHFSLWFEETDITNKTKKNQAYPLFRSANICIYACKQYWPIVESPVINLDTKQD